MACYHPLLAVKYSMTDPEWKVIGSFEDSDVTNLSFAKTMMVPCGHCIGCRLDYSRKWANRMALEKETTGDALFITLTYDEEHLPICYVYENITFGTLVLKDVQDFWKRFRKKLKGKKITYYQAGEYGDLTERPHYHFIAFGIGLDDIPKLKPDGKNELGNVWYRSEWLDDIWKCGRVCIAEANWQTMAYVSRYVTKKVIGGDVRAHEFLGRHNEFATMSKNPAIGLRWLIENAPRIEDDRLTHIAIPGKGSVKIPKYFMDKAEKLGYNFLKVEPASDVDRVIQKIQNTDLSYVSQLEVEEGAKIEKVKKIMRDISRR